VSDVATRSAAEQLIREYLQFVGEIASRDYGLAFDVEAMLSSDLGDEEKFYPPAGRFYVVQHGDAFVGVGCLKRAGPGVGEIQRMYVRPSARGSGAGRRLVEQLIADARGMELDVVRLESLKALSAAHALYRSVGFKEIEPYAENSMRDYQSADAMERYRSSALFMELAL
jgi:ribosomal protein S18 acetylase RimI-like enzyme